ncbi:MAG: DUF86 domain-containing protein [Prolixibacteraceae bacterium]|nr:DUF86 domain-containing protein [Prolixibacteraceae bacterium]
MRDKIRDKERLNHIIESVGNIFEFTATISYEEFSANKMLKFAVIKNLEIIGEASNLLSNEIKDNFTEIDWKAIIGLRNFLVHGYYQISDMIIWNTIHEDLPGFLSQISSIKNSL